MISLAYPAFYEAFSKSIPKLGVVASPNGKLDIDILSASKVVIFTGGSDISPAIYGEENKNSYCDSRRDGIELEILDVIKKHFKNIKILGVCRGHQLVCSKLFRLPLIQDLGSENIRHGGSHTLDFTKENSIVKRFFTHVNSIHHQGIKYQEKDSFAKNVTSIYDGVVESVEVPSQNLITVQFHPEFMNNSESKRFFKFITEEW